MERWIAWVGRINRATAFFCGFLVVAMMVTVVWEVVLRYVFNMPTIWSLALTATYLFPACVFLGGAYTLQVGGHVSVDIFYGRLPSRLQGVLNIFSHIIILCFSLALVWQGWKMALNAFIKGEKIPDILLGWPLFLSEMVVFLGGFFVCIQIIVSLISNIVGLIKPNSDLKNG